MTAVPESNSLIVELAKLTTGQALMAQHPADATGHCQACRGGGDGSGRAIWPCSLHRLGQQVADLQRRRKTL